MFDAYEEGDPRRDATFVKNGDTWNGRTMEIFTGGQDDPAKEFASRTGYYLRKFLNDNLDLQNDQKVVRDWIRYRITSYNVCYTKLLRMFIHGCLVI